MITCNVCRFLLRMSISFGDDKRHNLEVGTTIHAYFHCSMKRTDRVVVSLMFAVYFVFHCMYILSRYMK